MKGSSFILKAVATILKKNTKGTILIGGDGGYEAGVSIEMLDSKSKKWLLDGWSIDTFGSKVSMGVGIAKDLYSNACIEIDAGVYATRPIIDFFKKKTATDIRFGISGSWKF